ncbi:MAG: hypothetical protein ACPG7F_02305 [Aggregatilineales bacterium]
MSRFSGQIIVILVISLSVIIQTAQENPPVPASELPLLRDDFHLGTTFYGSADIPDDDRLSAQIQDASAAGMNGFAYYVDWADLEAQPGTYTLNDFENTLAWLAEMNIQPLVNITLIDIESLQLHPDLPDEVLLDDPLIVDRLTRLLDEVVPLLLQYDGFVLLLGNEVDGYFATVPEEQLAAYARLINAARQHIHMISQELAVGVTLTGGEVFEQRAVFQALRPVTDTIPFNYYGLQTTLDDNWLSLIDFDEIPGIIARYVEIYDDTPIIIQELGCPASDLNESSLELQAACFEAFFEVIRAYPQIRYVAVFTMFDWDKTLCDIVVELLSSGEDDALPELYINRQRGFLCNIGLLNADYTAKPAWDIFIQALSG